MGTNAEERTYVPYTPQELDEIFNDGDPFEASDAPGGARENTRFDVRYANGDTYTESYGTEDGEKIVGDKATYNMIWGFGGDDFVDLEGAKGGSFVSGNEGHDLLIGGDSRDQLLGGEGNDDLRGNAGDDLTRVDEFPAAAVSHSATMLDHSMRSWYQRLSACVPPS